MATAPRHLRLHRRLWRYDRNIPKELRPFTENGGTRYRVYLKTSSVSEALAQRSRCDALFELEMDRARRRMNGKDTAQDVIRLAQEIRATFDGDEHGVGATYPPEEVIEDAERRFVPKHLVPAFRAALVADDVILVDAMLDEFLERDKHLDGKTLLERRNIIGKLKAFLGEAGIVDVRAMKRDTAKAFVKTFDGMAASTVSKVIQATSVYWKFMHDEGVVVDPGIWRGLRPKKSTREALADKEREFTDDELKKLFAGDASSRLRDMMTLALYTGARLSELGDLKVEHINFEKKTIRLPGSKTEAAPRLIPMHLELVALLQRRTEGKDGKAYLIDELTTKTLQHGRRRAAAVSQEFTRYRDSVGVTDKREGKRRDLVNFHSFRRTAATAMVEAGVADNVIDAFFGWSRQGPMRVRYAARADLMVHMRVAIGALRWKL